MIRQETKPASQRGLWPSIVLAFVLWIIIFVFRPLNFWILLTFSTSLLAAIAFAIGRPLIPSREFTAKNLLLGILLAALLYAIFYVGNQFLVLVSRLFSCSPSRPCRKHRFCLREPGRALPWPCRLSALFPHRVRRGNLLARFCAAPLQREMERQVRFRPHCPSLHRDPFSHRESGAHPCSSHLRPFLGRLLLGHRKSCPCACLSHALGSLHLRDITDQVIKRRIQKTEESIKPEGQQNSPEDTRKKKHEREVTLSCFCDGSWILLLLITGH